MQITAACPKCDNRYQFDSALVGQKIRCTNVKCRAVFEVREVIEELEEVEEAPVRPVRRDRRAPTFESDSGEMEAAQPAREAPREADWSAMPPPPVRRRDDPEPSAVVEPVPEPAEASADEVLAFMGVAPAAPAEDDYTLPKEGELIYEAEAEEAPVEQETDYEALYRQYGGSAKKGRGRFMILAMIGVVILGVVSIGGFFVFKGVQKSRAEVQIATEAEEDLKKKNYPAAHAGFEKLVTQYPNSNNVTRYRVMRDYCREIVAATDLGQPAEQRRRALTDYLLKIRDTGDWDILKGFQDEIHTAFVRIAEDEVRAAIKLADAKDFDAAKKGQVEAIATQGQILTYGSVPEDLGRLYTSLAEKIDEGERYTAFIKELDDRLSKPLTLAQVAVLQTDAQERGYHLRPDVVDRLSAAREKVIKQIVFKSLETSGALPPADDLASLIVGPNAEPVPENPEVLFALARGVLYALAEEKGQILWAARVGIDAATLPPRIPAAGSIPATVILPTPDGLGMMARELLTGKPRWYQRLPAPVRGQPLLVEGRIIAPLADDQGTVAVIESRDGLLQGMMALGERIGPGASLQPGTSRVFIPAESQSVFVLDANPPLADGQAPTLLSLVTILTTNHGPNSLRAEPVVVGGVDEATGQLGGTAYLILTQSDGFNDMKLRTFELTLPLREAVAGVEVKLPGWSWFPPFCDQEKVTVVTDAGALALLGINQKQNQDPPLFPLVVDAPAERTKTGRGQIVHAEEHGFWYLANDELQFKRVGFHGKDGIKLAPGWKSPLKLGSPLHAGQVSADRGTLFVVTQTTNPPAWLATAVNAETGAIIWQRPLGLAVAGDPIKVGDAIFQLDQGAGAYAVTPDQVSFPTGLEWAMAGTVMARPRQDVVGEPYLLAHPEGKLAFAVYAVGDGKTLHAVVLVPGQPASDPLTVPLPALLAGAPLLLDKALILPLADGGLHRWVIGDKEAKRGPDWRAPRLGETARALLARVGTDGVLVSDGLRGLTLYSWPADADHQLKQAGLTVPDRIIAAPLVLPTKENTPPRLAIADAAGRVTLLEGEPLTPTLKWEMRALRKGTEITAGPFLVMDKDEPRLLVVVDRTTLVCLHPEDRREAWSYKIKGDGLPQAPRAVNGSLILADVSGQFESVSVSTGQPQAAPFPPRGPLPAAPAAAPIDFGEKMFAPLTDGTVLLIPNDALTPKK